LVPPLEKVGREMVDPMVLVGGSPLECLEVPPILHEDTELLIVDKPSGMVVHPAYKHLNNTLTDAVFARQAACNQPRPWLLHRLDRETSGVVVFAKTEWARRHLVRQFELRTVEKRYLVIVSGFLDPASGLIDAPLRRDPTNRRRTVVAAGGQPAQTWYQVLATAANYSLVLTKPLTGRTHQIRAHLASLGAPVAGDICYDEHHEQIANVAPRVMLHAWQFACTHPLSRLPFLIMAPLPPDMRLCMGVLKLEAGFECPTGAMNT
jgi:23S rRNA pseudouridine1911/1915/1917 synthase